MKDLQKLKELAQAATPGPWTHEDPVVWGLSRGGRVVAGQERVLTGAEGPNGAYAAAMDPSTALALIERLEKAEEDLALIRSANQPVEEKMYEEFLSFLDNNYPCGCGDECTGNAEEAAEMVRVVKKYIDR